VEFFGMLRFPVPLERYLFLFDRGFLGRTWHLV
jgi:hypothetical protein